MKPYPVLDNAAEIKFNRKHSAARKVIERAFGMVKGRFRRLLECLPLDLENVCATVDAAFIHNICLEFQNICGPDWINDAVESSISFNSNRLQKNSEHC